MTVVTQSFAARTVSTPSNSGELYKDSFTNQSFNPLNVQITTNSIVSSAQSPHFVFPSNHGFHEEWFSLEGYLLMKCQTGALTFLHSKKRMYFGLEELENKLIYYRDKADFDKRRECLGTIFLNNTVCSLIENNLCAFVLHSAGKKYFLEAENEKCAHCWLHALQQRRDVNDNSLKILELPTMILNAIRRHRSRSHSEHSDTDSDEMLHYPQSTPKKPTLQTKLSLPRNSF